jgi:phenylacetate-coenzyme A ligase PaaK-like adenylate-forming protein
LAPAFLSPGYSRLISVAAGGAVISTQANLPEWSFSESHRLLAQQTLETALAQVPFYQNWRGYDPGPRFPVEKRYAAMPVFTKKDIRENFPGRLLPIGSELNKAIESKEINLVETSGTTDDKVTNIWNQKWWDASEISSWQLNSVMASITTGQHAEAILVNPKNVGIRSDESDLPMEKRQTGRFLYLNEKTDPLAWSSALMDRMVSEINDFQPVVLEANPSYLARLARYIEAKGCSVFQPQAVVFTYEYPTLLHRRQIARVFRTPLISSYGTTETGYVFMQCEKGLFHQNSDFCQVDFQPLNEAQGGPFLGRILVTPLGNPWCYYLHFDTGDIVQLESSGHCPCGRSSGIILSALAGRRVNLTLTSQGRLVTLLELDTALSNLPDIQEYQLIQPAAGQYDLYLAGDRLYKTNLDRQASAILKNIYGSQSQINIIYTEAIQPEISGKYLLAKAFFPVELERHLLR